MKRKNFLIIIVLILALAAYFGYRYLYHSHRNIQQEAPMASMPVADIQELFKAGKADSLMNKAVIVFGIVSELEGKSLTLEGGVFCSFDEMPTGLSLQQQITVKGRCVGYDDLFEIVKLDQCQTQ